MGNLAADDTNIFLSHNVEDKPFARRLAASLTLAGAQVWFDEWKIPLGSSIPSAINGGLSAFDTFVLIWSAAAAGSAWVTAERDAAFSRLMASDSMRLVPVRLDGTALPPLLQSIRHIDCTDGGNVRVARELLGIESDTAFRLAVQAFIDEAGIDFREFHGVGVLVACPRCGATVDSLEPWQDIDHERDDIYVGVRCTVCNWSDGSEM